MMGYACVFWVGGWAVLTIANTSYLQWYISTPWLTSSWDHMESIYSGEWEDGRMHGFGFIHMVSDMYAVSGRTNPEHPPNPHRPPTHS